MKARSSDFLVEIGTEELPPKSLFELANAFSDGIVAALVEAGLRHGRVHTHATPRRLAVMIEHLALQQPDQHIERRGPPVGAAFDAAGNPTRAALAFAQSNGCSVADLGRVQEAKGEFLFYRGTRAGAAARTLLPGIVDRSLAALPIAKRMRWGARETQFVRPVHWVVMLHGRDVVESEILGVTAGRTTRGHRFLAPKPIVLSSPAQYLGRLENRGHVVADVRLRRERVREGVLAAAREAGGEAIIEDALLDEVTALVEWPVPLVGHIDARFLELPPEVLIATIQDHQRYFPVRDAQGALLPRFVFVANIVSRDPAQVRAGNERVVRPRLADSAFFYSQDRRQPLAARCAALGTVTYQTQLGSLADRTTRVRLLAAGIAAALGADRARAERAAELAKCDLLSSMVGEFPELQGVMGGYYARHDGEADEVAQAIAEQYRPRFAGDTLPETGAGTSVALADRLDTIAGIFAIGQKPSGTKDPFGLRRAALGVLRIIVERGLELDLMALIRQALEQAQRDIARIAAGGTDGAGAHAADATKLADEIYDYVIERLRAYAMEADRLVTTEVFDAVLTRRPASVLDFQARLRALIAFLQLPDAASLAAANKRIANILRKNPTGSAHRVDESLLGLPAEQRLHADIGALQAEVEAALANRRYDEALRRLATLRPAVDAFFDQVLVMDPDVALRDNRLALLAMLSRMFLAVADLSRLPG
jgi:glycyl-tRNA synthetase beta chain